MLKSFRIFWHKLPMKIRELAFIGTCTTLMTLTAPAEAFILQTSVPPVTNPPVSNYTVVGYQQTFTDLLGRNLTGISASSPSFTRTRFFGQGSNSVRVNYFSGSVDPANPFTLNVEIGDLPDSTNINVTSKLIVLDNDGNNLTIPDQRMTYGVTCTTQSPGTPYMAAKFEINTGGSDYQILGQCQGNTLGLINNQTGSYDVQLSIQNLPNGYQTMNELETFPPAQTITLNPGVNEAVAQIPEPSSILSVGILTGLGLINRLKRNKRE